MEKRFNTVGTCIKDKNYMVNVDEKLKKIEAMVDRGDYFVINRPRQYGKTTILSQLSNRIGNKYIVLRLTFEGIGDNSFSDENIFSRRIVKLLSKALKFVDIEKANLIVRLGENVEDIADLSDLISDFIEEINLKVVLIIDEVDKACNNQLFLSFLGMLRSKYLLAKEQLDYTFYSVILAGVHDVKNLKIKLRKDEEKKLNSPWNIAVDFNIEMSFNPEEIETMLQEYSQCINHKMDIKSLAEELYYYTNGYPFLVSRLCQIIDEKILGENKRPWIANDIRDAVKDISKEKNTLFDDLIKNLENNEELYKLVKDIVLEGKIIGFNLANPVINLGAMYGIFKGENYNVKLNNRIFEQYVYNYMISKIEIELDKMAAYNHKNNFITGDLKLDLKKVLQRFQQFMKEQFSSLDAEFIEREGRLIFLAFIKPIINGSGFDFKEVQISEEKRLDIVITYNNYKYVVELKIWRGQEYHNKGIRQLKDYLEIQELAQGFLVVYNFNKNKEYKQEEITCDGKKIYVVYV